MIFHYFTILMLSLVILSGKLPKRKQGIGAYSIKDSKNVTDCKIMWSVYNRYVTSYWIFQNDMGNYFKF